MKKDLLWVQYLLLENLQFWKFSNSASLHMKSIIVSWSVQIPCSNEAEGSSLLKILNFVEKRKFQVLTLVVPGVHRFPEWVSMNPEETNQNSLRTYSLYQLVWRIFRRNFFRRLDHLVEKTFGSEWHYWQNRWFNRLWIHWCSLNHRTLSCSNLVFKFFLSAESRHDT